MYIKVSSHRKYYNSTAISLISLMAVDAAKKKADQWFMMLLQATPLEFFLFEL